MKIIRLTIDSFKRIDCAEIEPNGNVVVKISGKNTSGKTSILDAIWAALEWRAASKKIKTPINRDRDSASISIDFGDFIVTRVFKNNETTELKINRRNGDEVKKPQTFLDGMVGEISFDPMEFCRKKPIEQKEIIARIIGLDISSFEQQRAKIFDKRSDVNREIVRLKGSISNILPPEDDESKDEVSTESLIEELQNASLEHSLMGEINELTTKLEAKKNELKLVPKCRSLSVVQSNIKNFEKINERARQIKKYTEMYSEILSLTKKSTELSKEIELENDKKNKALSNAKLPINGLTIEDDGISIDGLPWSEQSSAQEIRNAVAIGMASNPKLKILRISDGSLLDGDAMKTIEEMATQNDFQIWMEVVAEGPIESGVFVEDGKLV